MKKIMLIGESWFTYSVHQKGFDVFHTAEYVEGAEKFIHDLTQQGFEVFYVPAHEIERKVPAELDKLHEFDAIIISDVGANSFLLGRQTFNQSNVVPNKLAAIAQYVQEGGALFMVGGYLSFTGIDAKARYGQSPLKDCLPITMMEVDDRVELPQGIHPKLAESTHTVVNGLPEKWPALLGYNKIMAKPDARVLVKVGADPLLVIGSFGKGRTAAYASDIAPHWAPPQFVEWEAYPLIWRQLMDWLTE